MIRVENYEYDSKTKRASVRVSRMVEEECDPNASSSNDEIGTKTRRTISQKRKKKSSIVDIDQGLILAHLATSGEKSSMDKLDVLKQGCTESWGIAYFAEKACTILVQDDGNKVLEFPDKFAATAGLEAVSSLGDKLVKLLGQVNARVEQAEEELPETHPSERRRTFIGALARKVFGVKSKRTTPSKLGREDRTLERYSLEVDLGIDHACGRIAEMYRVLNEIYRPFPGRRRFADTFQEIKEKIKLALPRESRSEIHTSDSEDDEDEMEFQPRLSGAAHSKFEWTPMFGLQHLPEEEEPDNDDDDEDDYHADSEADVEDDDTKKDQIEQYRTGTEKKSDAKKSGAVRYERAVEALELYTRYKEEEMETSSARSSSRYSSFGPTALDLFIEACYQLDKVEKVHERYESKSLHELQRYIQTL